MILTLIAATVAAAAEPAAPVTPAAAVVPAVEKKADCCDKMKAGEGCDCCKDMDGKDAAQKDGHTHQR